MGLGLKEGAKLAGAVYALLILYNVFKNRKFIQKTKYRKGKIENFMQSFVDKPSPDVDNNQLLIFIHGAPDDEKLWDNQVAFFTRQGYTCLRLLIPDYDGLQTKHHRYSFDEIADLMENTLSKFINIDNRNKFNKIFHINHDWGTWIYYWYSVKYKNNMSYQINKVVNLDIGSHLDLNNPLFYFVYRTYQKYLSWSYLIGNEIGNVMLHLLLPFMNNFGLLNDLHCCKYSKPNSSMCYLYKNADENRATFQNVIKQYDFHSGIPHLFIYGKMKPIQFFNKEFVDKVKSSHSQSKVIGYPYSVHWVSVDYPDRFNSDVLKFIQQD
jgi:pimeloyl-ACP methyl ester carboxylesterase